MHPTSSGATAAQWKASAMSGAADLRSVLSRRAHAPTLKLAIKRLSSCTVRQSQHHDPSPRARRHSMGFAHLRTSSLSDRVYRLT